jgi:hypothetical protein
MIKHGISSHELGNAPGITQKSAWFKLHRIRMAMQTKPFLQLSGKVKIGLHRRSPPKWRAIQRTASAGSTAAGPICRLVESVLATHGRNVRRDQRAAHQKRHAAGLGVELICRLPLPAIPYCRMGHPEVVYRNVVPNVGISLPANSSDCSSMVGQSWECDISK